jgi:orotate phosphoribosyltransferase
MPIKTTEQWIDQYKKKNALWIHDGNPRRPHALLTSEKHSNGFFNSRLVIPDENLLRHAASDLLELFVYQGGDISKVQIVVGPQTGATKLAELISYQIMEYVRTDCFWASPAKNENEGQKSMIFTEKDIYILSRGSILLCEDVLTTGGSIDRTFDAISNAGGIVLPFILVLVNRSGLQEINGKKIIALIDHNMSTWEPDECPLCKQNSLAVRPKENWAALNAVY